MPKHDLQFWEAGFQRVSRSLIYPKTCLWGRVWMGLGCLSEDRKTFGSTSGMTCLWLGGKFAWDKISLLIDRNLVCFYY